MKTKLRRDRKLCANCRKRPAVFKSPTRGFITKDDGHDLCPLCTRRAIDRERSRRAHAQHQAAHFFVE